MFLWSTTMGNFRLMYFPGTAEAKLEALRDAGIEIAETPADMGTAMVRAIQRKT